jgi:hypothetical protein
MSGWDLDRGGTPFNLLERAFTGTAWKAAVALMEGYLFALWSDIVVWWHPSTFAPCTAVYVPS